MKALITGASSGIGRDMAIILDKLGYDLILVARRKDRLVELQKQLTNKVEIYTYDLSSTFNCVKLFNKVKKEDIEILVNNAGFGVFGDFTSTNMDKELDMIDTNIKAVHVLTKLFLGKFKEKDRGYILNVASSAAFQPGPLMASYYASKSYVYYLSCALYEELRREGSNVHISVLCPGPVDTEFNDVAGVTFGVKPLTSKYVANYAIKKMFKNKLVIIPGTGLKLAKFFGRFAPLKLLLKIIYNVQKKKVN